MFSHPLDPPSVTAARATEAAYIAKWVAQARARAGDSSHAPGASVASAGGGSPKGGAAGAALHLEAGGAAGVQ